MDIKKLVLNPWVMIAILVLATGGGYIFYTQQRVSTSKLDALADQDGTAPPKSPQDAAAVSPAPQPRPLKVDGLNENMYNWNNWKSGDVVRFEYAKTITLKQLDDEDKDSVRVTDVNGYINFEIKSVTPAGATGLFRFEPKSKGVVIPELYVFSSQYGAPQLQTGKSQLIAQDMAVILASKTVSWGVKISNSGLVYIESRTPAQLRDWFKLVETTAAWRRKSLENLPKLIEQDLGFKVPSHDRNMFLCLSTSSQVGGIPADPLRPRREILTSTVMPDDDTKTKVTFAQIKPSSTGGKEDVYIVPGLARNERITGVLKEVETTTGVAIFDTQMGMIDSLNEDYTMKLFYQYGPNLKLDQWVRVQYRLKRLIVAKP